MKMLAVFLLAALGCSLAEGRLVSKCDLRDQLMRALGDLTAKGKQKGLTEENLVAKVVCHVELASGFNTSAVNELMTRMEDDHQRRRRNAPYGGLFRLAEEEGHFGTDQPTPPQPHTRPSSRFPMAPPNRPPMSKHLPLYSPPRMASVTPPNGPPLHYRTPASTQSAPTPPPTRSPLRYRMAPVTQPTQEVWTLYGLFQLSNHLVCSDGMTPSPNICGISCSNLVDDDIRDDTSCLLKILTNLVEHGFGAAHWEELKRMIRFIFQEECRDEKASDYFAEC